MALSLATLVQIHNILTSERMSYKGSEIATLVGVLSEVSQELTRAQMAQDKATLQSRIVPITGTSPKAEG